ncbi:S-adenosyl-L-methionine-dependent methyltransferase [Artomyces pyxidatus]|uniref:S-adenosyl-L-methionine-dependent methyltransferase n=1 Tax=Artomyces pyxidatus TaxID=48021 RepID=A0ACB8T8Q7_9AGAM|nr:S-adenosyl-L-methionine-dependent methyltransferase [Artomyces pyxidatus]
MKPYVLVPRSAFPPPKKRRTLAQPFYISLPPKGTGAALSFQKETVTHEDEDDGRLVSDDSGDEGLLKKSADHGNKARVNKSSGKLCSSRPYPLPSEPEDPRRYETVIYEVHADELVEDDNLQILGETTGDADAEDIPVRVLSHFSIYKIDTQELVDIAELLLPNSGAYGASGTVAPWASDEEAEDEDEDEDEDKDEDGEDDETADPGPVQWIQLSPILRINVHDISEDGELDVKIYLQTKYAWYILETPSPTYQPFFLPFWLKHRVLHLIVSTAMFAERTTYEKFITSLQLSESSSDDAAAALDVLGREITEEDLNCDDVMSYVLGGLADLREQGIKLGRVPLIRFLMDRSSQTLLHDDYAVPHRISRAERIDSNPEKEVLKHRNPTVVTHTVGEISEDLFNRTLQLAGQAVLDDSFNDEPVIDKAALHLGNPSSIKWVKHAGHSGFFRSVKIDGAIYGIGNVVVVEPGEDEDKIRSTNAKHPAAQNKNSLAEKWFARIQYLFEDSYGRKYFHGQWLVHGSKTILQEIAHPRSLFLMDACDDIPLAAVICKCNLRWLEQDEPDPASEELGVENSFFCSGITWDEEESAFVQHRDQSHTLSHCKPYKECIPCGVKKAEESNRKIVLSAGHLIQHGITYHQGDCVYLYHPKDHDAPYIVAQILDFEATNSNPDSITITVREFGRYDDVVRRELRRYSSLTRWQKDERRLFLTARTEKIVPSRIAGKCFIGHLDSVQDLEEWLSYDDHYYAPNYSDSSAASKRSRLEPLEVEELDVCTTCFDAHTAALAKKKELLEGHEPMRGLELFSGAGGLSTGFDMSGFVDTRWAIEFSPSCCLSYKENKSQTTVYNQCTNMLLQHAIDIRDGKNPAALKSNLDKKTRLPPMPQPGDVDFIYGGLPCQSYSGANRHKKADDVRSTLVCNMLSYVEFYKPSYFLLENVVGLVHFPLKGSQDGKRLVDGIKMGVVKFILRTLTALGYQARFKVLQAGHYGAPQGRRRVIFWGARRGVPLPLFPVPTHCFERQHDVLLRTGKKLHPVTRSLDPDEHNGAAPLYPVTVEDAIGDLPPFDWKNPHQVIPRRKRDAEEEATRKAAGIPAFDAERGTHYTGFYKPVRYASAPRTRFQQQVRAENGGAVEGHYTGWFTVPVIERVMNIPLEPDADYRDLPAALAMGKKAAPGPGQKVISGLYQRVAAKGHFRTAMTMVRPNSHGSAVLHPTQKRVLTVRECARAQGFPDHWQFLSVNKNPREVLNDQLRQIGNAVPIPLARALGGALGDALLGMWEREVDPDREGSEEL